MISKNDMYKVGTIVLVPFPFTDLSGDKVRPALILSNNKTGDDVTVCFLSSVIPKKILSAEIFVNEKSSDFKTTGLKSSSVIKVTKLATLDKKVILGEIGILSIKIMREVKGIIKKHFDL